MAPPFPFSDILTWYQKHGRHDLPWRQIYHLPVKERLYKIWIAEVMLQQTQVDRVIGYYNKFLKKYPTIESLANTTYEELFPYYQGLGYYGRAKRMIELAKVVVEKYKGIFPDDFEKLRKLPGIGKYTAQALLAFGYDEPVLAIDANLQKIFARYYFGNRTASLSEEIMDNLIEDLKKKEISGRDINNALMDFGAMTGVSYEKLDLKNYPLKNCKWLETKGTLEVKREKKIKRSEKGAKLIVFLHESHKTYCSSLKNRYEPFLIEPTGKDDRRTVQDYFSATFGLEVSVRPSFGFGIHDKMNVKLFHAQIQTGKPGFPIFGKIDKETWISTNILEK